MTGGRVPYCVTSSGDERHVQLRENDDTVSSTLNVKENCVHWMKVQIKSERSFITSSSIWAQISWGEYRPQVSNTSSVWCWSTTWTHLWPISGQLMSQDSAWAFCAKVKKSRNWSWDSKCVQFIFSVSEWIWGCCRPLIRLIIQTDCSTEAQRGQWGLFF